MSNISYIISGIYAQSEKVFCILTLENNFLGFHQFNFSFHIQAFSFADLLSLCALLYEDGHLF